jgi:hypothetical protein
MEFAHLEQIFGALQGAEVRYLVVGGMAVIAHGYMRTTKDIDLVIALEPENLKRALTVLTEIGYRPKIPVAAVDFADPVKREAWIRDKGMVVFQLVSDRFRFEPLDIFVTEPFDFQTEYDQAVWKRVNEDVSVPIVSVRQLLDMKRAAARPQDLADIAELSILQKEDESGAN